MDLPDNSIGITDILSYRECPRRMTYGMRRHTGEERVVSPEKDVAGPVWASFYGSAIHEVIHAVDEGSPDEEAIQEAWNKYGHHLEPEDLDLLRSDLETYRKRDVKGVRIVASEDEFRVPLFKHNGEQIYFRFKLDRLYEIVASPGTFVHIDYKSSKWAKSEKEVHEDKQLWAYNFGIYEFWPEIQRLEQVYDQLRYGQIPTRKTDQQRAQIREWLIRNVTTILDDDDYQPDGLLPFRYNRWCKWCPILESCGIVEKLSEFALTEIAAMAPMRAKIKKDGTPGKQMEAVPLDSGKLPEYAARYAKVKAATGILERFSESVAGLVKQMPKADRAKLGFELRERTSSTFTPDAARRLHEALGEQFYSVVGLAKTRLESELGNDAELLEWALNLADKSAGSASVHYVGKDDDE